MVVYLVYLEVSEVCVNVHDIDFLLLLLLLLLSVRTISKNAICCVYVEIDLIVYFFTNNNDGK